MSMGRWTPGWDVDCEERVFERELGNRELPRGFIQIKVIDSSRRSYGKLFLPTYA